ncbi:MAG: porin [Aquabacterium sp.]|uniref:porin n=1 Tax=Aquabacterium sp. TaxID=1872578 RepID=UPI0011FA923F|nr:porin [Aquabacterium sp.]TAK97359.1 MAG: porin [Aquabacterium sp.]
MQKTVLTKAVAVALATLGASAAFAQSSMTIYGNVDAALDNVHKASGSSITGAAAAASTVTRVSPSISSQNALGFKGTEDIGGGYKASFILEGQFNTDTGVQGGQDTRMWGRQSYVGLATPVGELRIGRQYAPIFYAFATSSVESIGAADLMASGLVVNNLQVRQDNQISYWIKAGDLTGALSYSPNGGVSNKVNALRNGTGGSSTSGQIIGGVSAGDENNTGRGKSYGLYLNYAVDPALSIMGGYHSNKFGDAILISTTGTTLASMDKYIGYTLGGKYTVPGMGTVIGTNFLQGNFTNDPGSMIGPKVQVLTFGVKHPIDQFAVGVEGVYSRFTNFTKGKDRGLMFAGDYNLSKRTRVYARAGAIKDTGGETAATDSGAVNVIGGPLPVLTTFGSTETPFFAGGSANVNAWTRVFAVGVRHQF